jgi:ribose 5-phosphate isomerase B
VSAVRIVLGTDEQTPLTEALTAHLREGGHHVEALEPDAWPDVGRVVGRTVRDGAADVGVVCCTTGTGVALAANKVPGVRAALCTDAATAVGARRWNDANVLALGLRLTSIPVAYEIVDAFCATPFDPDEQDMVDRVER